MITEVSVFQLRAETDLENPSSSGSKTIQVFLSDMLSAQGSSYSYYGQSTEQPKKVFVFVQWESIDHRKRYMSLP